MINIRLILAGVAAISVLSMPVSQTLAAGSNRQALTTTHLRVCADPNNLPFSNEAQEGLENRVIDLLAEELGKEVRYTWFPQSVGFVRNTLRLRQCDLISGITTTSEKVQNTNPYYHSAYAIVQREIFTATYRIDGRRAVIFFETRCGSWHATRRHTCG